MAVLAGCGSSNPRPAARFVESCLVPQAAPLKTHVHGNGLQLSVSETCKVTITSAGFVVEPPDWRQLRYPFKVSIQLQTAPPKVKRQVHYLGSGRFLWYSATSEGDQGASGDPLWDVTAYERVGVGNDWVQYWENRQDEWLPGELWEVARGLRYVPSS
jgi:hypothetical protein